MSNTRGNIEKLLELITDIVNDDSSPWGEKRDLIKSIAAEVENQNTALEEFVSWWPDDLEA